MSTTYYEWTAKCRKCGDVYVMESFDKFGRKPDTARSRNFCPNCQAMITWSYRRKTKY
tara:strand:+ start:410 stop:583 length:174 start_codon:yes stop_codon:yes gene_type:complete